MPLFRYCLRLCADFGLSWKLSSGQEHISNARQGTGFYISPEVLHVGIMSKPADVFSFGMVLHEVSAFGMHCPLLRTHRLHARICQETLHGIQ